MTAVTPAIESYIAANEAITAANEVLITVLTVASIAFVISGAVLAWHYLRKQPSCGVHEFISRHDQWLDGDVWRHTYVRDVCSHCGVTVERADMLPEAKETDQ